MLVVTLSMRLSAGSVVTDDLTARLGALAHKTNVTIVGVTETVLSGASYQNWMLQLLDGTKCGAESIGRHFRFGSLADYPVRARQVRSRV
jgi:hypothetical protein